MKIVDLCDGREYTAADLKREWDQLREQEPENHASSFRTEFFEILMATVNGRNDLDIVGLTPREISSIIIRLRKKI